jgi:error-prone DNA polymerase
MSQANDYIELHASSAFSFLAAASQPEALAERAQQLEMSAIAIADRNGVYGAARFHTIATKMRCQGTHRRGNRSQLIRQCANSP